MLIRRDILISLYVYDKQTSCLPSEKKNICMHIERERTISLYASGIVRVTNWNVHYNCTGENKDIILNMFYFLNFYISSICRKCNWSASAKWKRNIEMIPASTANTN